MALASTVSGEVVLARDPLGVKPLFYSLDSQHSLWFASELAALAAAGASLGGRDPVALAQFLSFLWVPDPRTPFQGARSLEPGQALRWTPEGVELFSYGDALAPVAQPEPLASQRCLDEVRGRFSDAARRQLVADVPIGLMASGGVDSGLLWWATKDALAKAYSISWAGADDFEGPDDDRRAVVELEPRFATSVDYLPGEEAADVLPSSGDLFADPAYGLTRLIAHRARDQGCKVLLSRQGETNSSPATDATAWRRWWGACASVAWERPSSARCGTCRAAGWRASTPPAWPGPAPKRIPSAPTCSPAPTPRRRNGAQALGCSEAEVSNEVVWQRQRQVFERLPSLGAVVPAPGLAGRPCRWSPLARQRRARFEVKRSRRPSDASCSYSTGKNTLRTA